MAAWDPEESQRSGAVGCQGRGGSSMFSVFGVRTSAQTSSVSPYVSSFPHPPWFQSSSAIWLLCWSFSLAFISNVVVYVDWVLVLMGAAFLGYVTWLRSWRIGPRILNCLCF